MDGIIKYFNRERQFGFISPLIGRESKEGRVMDLFFHASQLVNAHVVPRGALCHFKLVAGADGRPQAAEVKLDRLTSWALLKPSREGFRPDG